MKKSNEKRKEVKTMAKASYHYKPHDLFYDVESLSNIFTVAHYYPAKNMLIISYLDDDNIIQSNAHLELIREKIREVNPATLNMRIFFENLSSSNTKNTNDKGEIEGTLLTFARRYGITSEENMLNNFNYKQAVQAPTQRIHNGYYPVKDTDPMYNPESQGLFFGYNSKNYDMTILAYLISLIPPSVLNNGTTPFRQIAQPNNLIDVLINQGSLPITTRILPTAQELRRFNDRMFSSRFIDKMPSILKSLNEHNQVTMKNNESSNFKHPSRYIRQGWVVTNRYVDVAALNEKQAKVGLKRLAGMLGLQIKESDRLNGSLTFVDNIEDIAELVAYNVSDVLCTRSLFEHKLYQNNFKLRKNLLKLYPEAIYEKQAYAYKADINPNRVKWNRLTLNSTSQQFVTQVIAPYNKLVDDPSISFMYPAKEVADRLGIKQFNVLDESMRWAKENIPNGEQAFKPIYDFYRQIEGRNANETILDNEVTVVVDNTTGLLYPIDKDGLIRWVSNGKGEIRLLDTAISPSTTMITKKVSVRDVFPFIELSDVQKRKEHNTNWFYRTNRIDAKGNAIESSCMVTFSSGGIHGQEIDVRHLDNVMKQHQSLYDALQQAKADFKNDATLAYRENRQYDVYMPIAKQKKKFTWKKLKSSKLCETGSTALNATWANFTVPNRDEILFSYSAKTGWKLNKDFAYVSVGKANHEDFASYYPLLLSRLAVFKNPEMDGDTDPYYNMFLDRLADKEKTMALYNKAETEETEQGATPMVIQLFEEADLLDLQQDSKKLLLNAASGAGDAKFPSNIRKNNAVISMRIIGQLFAWRIGQAQTLYGARVPSTNTDGLYTMDIEADLNNKVLMDVVKDMYVDIKPELIDRFATKDSNNRAEYHKGKITSAKGSALSSHNGPSPTQALNHPAITDTILAQYLCKHPRNPVNEKFNRSFAKELLAQFISNNDLIEVLRHFQWIVAAKATSGRYPFIRKIKAVDPLTVTDDVLREHIESLSIEEKTVDNGGLEYVKEKGARTISKYNRVFLIKRPIDDTPFETLESTAVRTVNEQDRKKRKLKGLPITESDKIAVRILAEHDRTLNDDNYEEAILTKISNMPTNQAIIIENQELARLENPLELFNLLDIETYIDLVETTFNNSWLNNSEPMVTYQSA